METTETKTKGIVMLGLKGKLDATTSPQLQEKLFATIAGGEKQFAIDCAQLEYISSVGLRTLLLAVKQLRTVNGKIVLYALKTHVKEVFDLAGFSAAIPLFGSQTEALASFTI
jgi:anti-sigma B factor antagonist